MLRRLLVEHLRPYRRTLALLVVLQAVQAAAALALPALNAGIINRGVLAGDNGYIRSYGAVMLGFALVQVVFASAAVYVGSSVAMRLGRDLRSGLYHRVTHFSTREVGTFGAPSLITRVTNDVQQVQLLVVMACTIAVAAPITAAVGVVMAVREDIALSRILVVAIPVAAVVLGVIVAKMVPAFRLMQERIDHLNQVLREQITGIRVVRAFVREPEETRRFGVANDELTDVSLWAGRLQSMMFPMINLIINLASVAVLWIGAGRVADGDIQLGSMVAYLTYLVQILMSVMLATFTMSLVPRASVSADRVQAVLDTESTVAPPVVPVQVPVRRGELELRDVGFHYPGAEHAVLQHISLQIMPGQTTALIGSTGAGKTTVVNLVPRLTDCTAGAVLVGGVDVRDLDPDVLSASIGLVPQQPYLFSGTVASNLRFGKVDATEAEMWEALAVAQAEGFVRAMSGGLDAHIDQGGTNVSGGQRQRLSIARALIRQPDIYVFDDAFSALDLTTDARLRAALVPYTAGSAVLIVAQRVTTISLADEIIVLEDGQIVGRGTHDELIVDCPTYAEIVESQIGDRDAA